jgi:hypothetical protein
MIDGLTILISVTALLLAAWCGFAAKRDQATQDRHLIGMAVVSLFALAQLVVGIVELAGGHRPGGGMPVFLAYVVGTAVVIPAAGFMSLVERTRWGSAIAAVGGVVLAALELRLVEIWGGGHG